MMNIDRTPSSSSSFTRFFGENSSQSSRYRSRAGLLIAMLLLPLLLGVLACMPVPIGDPEESRIDPALSGVWLTDLAEDMPLMVFDPYDKRTWLVSWFELEEREPIVSGQNGSANLDQENQAATTNELLQMNQCSVEGFILFKGWLTTIGGEHFLTLEQKTFEPGATPEYWHVFQVKTVGGDRLQLKGVNGDFDGFEDVETTKEAEEVIRQNLENTDLFGDTLNYQKASNNELEMFSQLLEDFGLDPD